MHILERASAVARGNELIDSLLGELGFGKTNFAGEKHVLLGEYVFDRFIILVVGDETGFFHYI